MISRLGDRNNLLKPSNFMNMSKIKGKENKETIRKKEKDEDYRSEMKLVILGEQ